MGSSPTPATNSRDLTYDSADNMTFDGLYSYNWDAENHLKSIDNGTNGTFTYNAYGWRVYSSLGTVSFLYSPSGQMIGGNWANGTGWNAGIRFGSRLLAMYGGDGSHSAYFTHANALDSETQTTDYAGNGGQPILFFPYGQKMSVSSTLYPNTVHQLFAGLQLYDTSTDGYVPPARYYIPEQGRWLTPDPAGKGAVHVDDPQTWNMYAYVRNNPTTLTDPSGKAVELKGNADQRKKQLAALQQAVGSQAGAYLYQNPITTTDSSGKVVTRYYVGIYSNGPGGNFPSFSNINAVSNKLAAIVQDSRVASLEFTQPRRFGSVEVGSIDEGRSPAVTLAIPSDAVTFITSGTFGNLPGSLLGTGKAEKQSLADIEIHELGHVDGTWFHQGQDSEGDAVRIENQARQIEGEPPRLGHNEPGDVSLSGPF